MRCASTSIRCLDWVTLPHATLSPIWIGGDRTGASVISLRDCKTSQPGAHWHLPNLACVLGLSEFQCANSVLRVRCRQIGNLLGRQSAQEHSHRGRVLIRKCCERVAAFGRDEVSTRSGNFHISDSEGEESSASTCSSRSSSSSPSEVCAAEDQQVNLVIIAERTCSTERAVPMLREGMPLCANCSLNLRHIVRRLCSVRLGRRCDAELVVAL